MKTSAATAAMLLVISCALLPACIGGQDNRQASSPQQKATALPPAQGILLKVEADRIWLSRGEPVNIKATYTNNESRPLAVVFKAGAYMEGTDTAYFKSEEARTGPGETVELSATFTPANFGRYLVKGRVESSSGSSEEKSTILNVKEPGA